MLDQRSAGAIGARITPRSGQLSRALLVMFGVYHSFVYTLPVASAIAIAPKTTAPDLVSRSQIRGFPPAPRSSPRIYLSAMPVDDLAQTGDDYS